MYQKCPICHGEGTVTQPLSTSPFKTCPTCRGARIISTVNGLPPASEVSEPKLFQAGVTITTTEFGDKPWVYRFDRLPTKDDEDEKGFVTGLMADGKAWQFTCEMVVMNDKILYWLKNERPWGA
jgi:hypothetical protein